MLAVKSIFWVCKIISKYHLKGLKNRERERERERESQIDKVRERGEEDEVATAKISPRH